jgi:hypothetical protein
MYEPIKKASQITIVKATAAKALTNDSANSGGVCVTTPVKETQDM